MNKTPEPAQATLPWKSGLLLALIAVVGVALLSGIHELTRERIAAQERQLIIERLAQVLGTDRYDNDLLADAITMTDHGAFGHDRPVKIYRARLQGSPVALIMELIAPDGYNGDIKLLLGIQYDGRISGARILQHKETPGLGDPIEARRSGWILGFTDRSYSDPAPDQWAVRKDGGAFDQFTGATITPRAVVRAIARALAYHEERREQLYSKEAINDSE